MIDDVYTQFIDGGRDRARHGHATRCAQLADGRLFSGEQAKAAGLVDELGGLDARSRSRGARRADGRAARHARVHGAVVALVVRTCIGEALDPRATGPGVRRAVLPVQEEHDHNRTERFMTKRDLIDEVVKHLPRFSRRDAEVIVNAVFDTMTEALVPR